MLDDSEMLCVMAGVSAIGFIWWSQQNKHMLIKPTECSARKSNIISARATTVTSPTTVSSDQELFTSDIWGNMSEEGIKQMSQSTPAIRSEQSRIAENDVRAGVRLKSTNAKTLGAQVLTAGRCPEGDKKPHRKSAQDLMFLNLPPSLEDLDDEEE